jgi:hypothetical protein
MISAAPREDPLKRLSLRLDLDQPQNHVAIVLSRPTHGPETVEDGRLDVHHASAAKADGPDFNAARCGASVAQGN